MEVEEITGRDSRHKADKCTPGGRVIRVRSDSKIVVELLIATEQ